MFNSKRSEERKNYEDYKATNKETEWNFPFREALKKLLK